MKSRNTKKNSRTDWKKLRRMRDHDIDHSDIPPLDSHFFKRATLKMPEPKPVITIRLDPDILNWFKRHGKGYQTRINAVLKMYVEAQGRN